MAVVNGRVIIKIKLMSQDGEIIEVDEDVAIQSGLLKTMLRDLGIADADDKRLEEPLPLLNLDGWTMKRLIDWCVAHQGEVFTPKADHEDPRIELTQNDERYMGVSADELESMLVGATYMDIPGIVEIITQKIANMAIDKSVEEIRDIFGLENDFAPKEEQDNAKKFGWVDA